MFLNKIKLPFLPILQTLLTALLPFLWITGCTPDGGQSDGAGKEGPGLEAKALPNFSFTDHQGKEFGTEQLAGRVWVTGFMHTRCEDPCLAVTGSMTRIQNTLFNHPDADSIRLVSFGLDPVSDTVSALKTYARERAFAYEDRWRFLSTDPTAAAPLLNTLDIELGDPGAADQTFSGAETLALVDREGKVRGLWDGRSEEQVQELIFRLEELLAEPSSTVAQKASPLPSVPFPPGALNPPWLEPRKEAQLATAADIAVRHDFGFEDRRDASGITFINRVVDDAGRHYKGVHYDHGNGLAIADVDGDSFYDLYFTTQLGRNELWRNLGDGRFDNITTTAGVGLGDRISVTASFADIDNDGDPDLFVTTVRDGNALFRNEGDGKFTDITQEAGVAHAGHSSGAAFFDFDRDGHLDLFLTNIGRYTSEEQGRAGYWVGYEDAFSGHLFEDRTETSILYRNLGNGTFDNVTEAMNIVDGSWSGDVSPLDFDEDGWQDLYLLDMQGDDELYRNMAGQKFEKVSRPVLPATPWGSMGIKVFDFNNDRRMDIFLSDMHSDMSEIIGPEREKLKSRMQWSEQALGHGGHHAMGDEGPSIFGNALFHATGKGQYEEVSDAMGSENYWPWGLSTGDVNADGWEDVLLTSSMNYPWRYGVNSLLLNEGGKKFRDAEFILGIEPRFEGGRTSIPWFELDCSGDLSVHPTYPEICRDQTGLVMVEGALGSRSSVIFDLDHDGDLDIVTAEFNSPPQVLISNLTDQGPVNFLEIVLQGQSSNRDGLGARVTVKAGGRTLTKVHDGKSGYLSQSSMPLYFGLGDAQKISSIAVRWPSGEEQTLTDIETGGRRVIQEE